MIKHIINTVILFSAVQISASGNSSRCSSPHTEPRSGTPSRSGTPYSTYENNSHCSSPHTDLESNSNSPSASRSDWHPGWREIDKQVLGNTPPPLANNLSLAAMRNALDSLPKYGQNINKTALKDYDNLGSGSSSRSNSRSSSPTSSPQGYIHAAYRAASNNSSPVRWAGTQTPPYAGTPHSASGSSSPATSTSEWQTINQRTLKNSSACTSGNTSPVAWGFAQNISASTSANSSPTMMHYNAAILCPKASKGFGDGQRNQAKDATRDAEQRQFKNGPKNPIPNRQPQPHNQYQNQTYIEGDKFLFEAKMVQRDLENDINQLKDFIEQKNQADSEPELGWLDWIQDTCTIS